MSIKESAILLQTLYYLLYKATNNLEIADEILIDEHSLPEKRAYSDYNNRKMLVAIYKRHDGTDRARLVCWETLLFRDEVAIRLLFYDSAYAEYKVDDFRGYKDLFLVELKFNESLSKIESWMLAQFIAFVTYRLCSNDYAIGRCILIYGGGKHIFDEEQIKNVSERL